MLNGHTHTCAPKHVYEKNLDKKDDGIPYAHDQSIEEQAKIVN